MGRGLGAVLAIAMLGALVAAATGGAALKTKSASIELDANEVGSATAQCNRGTKAVTGGFAMADRSAIFEAVRAGKRKWTVTGRSPGLEAGTLTTFVYCDKSGPRLKEKSSEVPFDPDTTTASATAKCKRGSEAVSGGFTSDPQFPPNAVALRRDGKRRWTASAINPGSTGTFTAFAYCDKSEPGLKPSSTTVAIGNFEPGSATTKCKRGTELVSGGFSSPEPMISGFSGPTVIVSDSHREGKRGWTASGRAGSGGGSLTVHAYCKKK